MATASAAPAALQEGPQGPRVLLVEDERATRALMGAYLRKNGYSVLEAATLAEADQHLSTPGIAVLIVDGLLPDGSGVDFMTDLRAKGSKVPAVFVSSFFRDAKSFSHLRKQLGVSAILYKPVNPAQLLEQVERLAAKPNTPAPKPAGQLQHVLVADDDNVTRKLVEATLSRRGYLVSTAEDGEKAFAILRGPEAPTIAVLDWNMPGLKGPEVCEKIRAERADEYTYCILLSARSDKSDVIAGLDAGADDYVSKPFHPDELFSRVRAGERVVALEQRLHRKISELEAQKLQVKQLQGLLPMCMYCKKIRSDERTWAAMESYIEEHTEAKFSHGLCEACLATHYKE